MPDLIGENSYSKKCNLKLKGGGMENLKVKRFTSDSKEINTALNSLRSSSMLDSFSKHKKCPPNMFCQFCLLRSIIFRINLPKGRQAIMPLEVECQSIITENITETEVLSSVLDNACNSFPAFADTIKPQWRCLCCQNMKSNDGKSIITLDSEAKNREISDLLNTKYNTIKEEHLKEALNHVVCHDTNFEMILQNGHKSCAFSSSENLELDLEEILRFGGKSWQCVGVISNLEESYFKVEKKWFVSSENKKEIEICKNFKIKNGCVAIYDEINIEDS